MLRIVAQRLASTGNDLVARLGGDEFAGVLTCPDREPAAHWWRPAITALAEAISEPIPVAGQTLSVTASIGVATADDDLLVGELLRRADLAMYHAKVNGGCFATWGRQPVNGAETVNPRESVLGGGDPEAIAATTAGPEFTEAAESGPHGYSPPPAPRVIEITLFPVAQHTAGAAAPTGDHPADPVPARMYRRDDPVWVYREGAWRPGVVESASGRAVMATYRFAGGRGTVVDTMAAEFVLARDAADAQLDRRAFGPRAAA